MNLWWNLCKNWTYDCWLARTSLFTPIDWSLWPLKGWQLMKLVINILYMSVSGKCFIIEWHMLKTLVTVDERWAFSEVWPPANPTVSRQKLITKHKVEAIDECPDWWTGSVDLFMTLSGPKHCIAVIAVMGSERLVGYFIPVWHSLFFCSMSEVH